MSLSQVERDERDLSMFGMLSDDLVELAETSIYRIGMEDNKHGDAMLIMSILSDAQDEMLLGDLEVARQFINRAKYIVHYSFMDRN